MPSRSLPALPHWEHIRKQAKNLLAELRANNPASVARANIYSSAFPPARITSAPSAFCLSDAQLIVAREYGFASWPRLKQHIAQIQAAHQAASPNRDSPQQAPAPEDSEILLETAPAREPYLSDAQAISSAAWVRTDTIYGGDMEVKPQSTQYWMSLNPPALAHRNECDNSWTHSVMDARGHLYTSSDRNHSVLAPMSDPYTTDGLLSKALFPHFSAKEDAEERAAELKTWRMQEIEQDGQRLLRWQRETISTKFQVTRTIWTEPETGRISRQERRETNLLIGSLASLQVRDRYTFNQPAPAGTFEMPPDKPLRMREDIPAPPEMWDALSSQERQGIQDVIARSDSGWRQADVRAFSSAWKFDFQMHLPQELDWKQGVEQQAGLWSAWTSQVTSANTQNYLPVRSSSDRRDWIVEKRKLLRVNVNLQVAWEEGTEGWAGEAEFFLRKHAGRYRIVHWECPWAEIEAAQKQAKAELRQKGRCF